MSDLAPIEHIQGFVNALTCLALLAVSTILCLEVVEFVRNDSRRPLSIRPPMADGDKRQFDETDEDLAA